MGGFGDAERHSTFVIPPFNFRFWRHRYRGVTEHALWRRSADDL